MLRLQRFEPGDQAFAQLDAAVPVGVADLSAVEAMCFGDQQASGGAVDVNRRQASLQVHGHWRMTVIAKPARRVVRGT